MAAIDEFKTYLKRQLSYRGPVYQKLGISKSAYYQHLKDPNRITLGELRMMYVIGELEEEKVMKFITGRK